MSSAADSKGGMGGMNMVTTVMAFSVSAFFVLFVFTRLLCARLHLSRAAAADRAAGDAFVVNVRRRAFPLPLSAVLCYPPLLFDGSDSCRESTLRAAVQVERGIHGLQPSVVTTFPTVKLSDGGPQRPPVPEESQCTVCLEEYEAKDVVRVLPTCGHAFHAPCIDAWLRQHPTCPVCRASLRAKQSSGNRATPLDYSVLVASAAATRAAPAASTTQVPASSSDITAASPQADGRHRTDTGTDGRLEIVIEEPASPGDQSPAAAVTGGGGSHSPCGEAARQSGSGAGASEHC
uniref:RING-type E3 ubiquitin transferase n=1 Tax=Setaria italica TaxID=4555 RepID=K3YUN4_SETIT